MFFSTLIQNVLDSLNTFVSSQVVRGHLLGLLEVIEGFDRVLHAFVNVRDVQGRLYIFRVQLECLFVVDQRVLVVTVVVESARQVKVAF